MSGFALSTTLRALIRTAKWAVDDSRQAHAETQAVLATAQGQSEAAAAALENAENKIRAAMASTMEVNTLQGAYLHRTVLQVELEEKRRLLHSANQRADETLQQLRAAQARLKLYERLLERRSGAQRRLDLQHRQREADDLGVTSRSQRTSIYDSNTQELGYGT